MIDVGPSVLSELDEAVVLDRVLEAAQQLVGAGYAALGVLGEGRGGFERFITRGIDEQAGRRVGQLPPGRGVPGVPIDQAGALRLADVREHPYSFGLPVGHPGMRMLLAVPILIGGQVWGNLYLTEKEGGGEFDQADEDGVVLLASWAAIAIDHARVHRSFTRRGRELERAVRGLQAIREIALSVGGEVDLERVLELVVNHGCALVEASSVVILLVEGEELEVAASAGDARRARGQRITIADSRFGETLRRGQPERIADVRARLGISPELLGASDSSATLVVPMLCRREPVGALIAFDHGSKTAFGGEHEELLRAFAATAAIAVATAQSVTAQHLQATLAAVEEERRRWGRELRDQTLQSLGALRVALVHARRQADLAGWQKASADMIEDVEREIENVRAIIANVTPPELDDIGLPAAIHAVCTRDHGATGPQVRCRLSPPDPSLGAELETTVDRLVRETLASIVNRAHSPTARIEIHAEEDHISVMVRDDGVGFDTEQPTSDFGLVGLGDPIVLDQEAEGGRRRREAAMGGRQTPGTLLDRNGWVIAGRGIGELPGWPELTVDTDGRTSVLPDGWGGEVERLECGDANLWARPRSRAWPPRLRLKLLGQHASAQLGAGRPEHALRSLELLAVLAMHPEGMTAEQLALALHGERGKAVTIRVQVHRVRDYLGAHAVDTHPYRLTVPVQADWAEVSRLVSAGRPREALRAYRGPLLAASDAPDIVEARALLEESLRRSILTTGDPDLLSAWLVYPSGADDLVAARVLVSVLPSGGPQRAAATATSAAIVRRRSHDAA